MEKWLPIEDFSNYEVSSLGRVRNVKTGRILKANRNSAGYLTVCLSKSSIKYTKCVHRLVADTFYDGDHEGLDVNHEDGNKNNNFIGNLYFCTRKENINHAIEHGLNRRIKIKRKVRVVETGKEYDTCVECSKDLDCAPSLIRRCAQGIMKTCHGYHIEFI